MQEVVDETKALVEHRDEKAKVLKQIETDIADIIESLSDPKETAREIVQYIADHEYEISEIWNLMWDDETEDE